MRRRGGKGGRVRWCRARVASGEERSGRRAEMARGVVASSSSSSSVVADILAATSSTRRTAPHHPARGRRGIARAREGSAGGEGETARAFGPARTSGGLVRDRGQVDEHRGVRRAHGDDGAKRRISTGREAVSVPRSNATGDVSRPRGRHRRAKPRARVAFGRRSAAEPEVARRRVRPRRDATGAESTKMSWTSDEETTKIATVHRSRARTGNHRSAR